MYTLWPCASSESLFVSSSLPSSGIDAKCSSASNSSATFAPSWSPVDCLITMEAFRARSHLSAKFSGIDTGPFWVSMSPSNPACFSRISATCRRSPRSRSNAASFIDGKYRGKSMSSWTGTIRFTASGIGWWSSIPFTPAGCTTIGMAGSDSTKREESSALADSGSLVGFPPV